MLRRSPAFAATALLTLALAIGGNTAIASLADAILLRPLPFPQPDRLAQVVTSFSAGTSLGRAPGREGSYGSENGESWETLRDRATTVDVALYAGEVGDHVNAVVSGTAATVHQQRVSAGYFGVLGVAPMTGREFSPDEDRPGGRPVALVSHAFWQRHLHGDPGVIGQTLLLRGEPHTIVGVMPPTFRGLMERADVWTPARPSRTGEGQGANYGIIARVKEGHGWPEANAELATLGRERFKNDRPASTDVWWSLLPLQAALTDEARRPIEMLAGAVGMVLLIACVNIASLLLARGRTRARELATRMALGSGRGAVVRQLAIEALVLGLMGGAAGALTGAGLLSALQTLGGETFTAWRDASIDVRVLAFTTALSVITSLLFGLVPALQTTRLNVTALLAGSSSRSVVGGRGHWLQRALVASQVCLGVVMLVITGLLVGPLVNLGRLEPGFDASNVMTASVSLQDARYRDAADVNRLFNDSLETLRRTPGIASAAVSLELPFRRLLNDGFELRDDGASQRLQSNATYVTPGFFATLQIPVRSGRDFTPRNRADSPAVAIVNETFVRSWGKGHDLLGHHLRSGKTDLEIVGVVGDVLVKDSGIAFPGHGTGPLIAAPIVFVPAAQVSDAFMQLVHTWFQPVWSVRLTAHVNATKLLPAAINQADPWLPVQHVQELSAARASAVATQRLLATLVGVLAAAAVLLAALGLHGLVTQGIIERTHEFGIRLALGASAVRVMRQVILSAVAVAGLGATAGLGLAWAAVAVFDAFSVLFNVDKHDPLTFVGVPIVLALVAIISSVIPAWRVLQLEPASTLKD